MAELSETQRRELRGLLEGALAELEAEREAARENARPVDLGLSIGRLSRMDALQQQQMAMERRRRMELRRVQLRAALERIGTEDYGACARCEEAIDFARLRARPEAVFCRRCQGAGGAPP